MKALSIRQPWAWLIITGVKPIENRKWQTPYRRPLLIHAAIQHAHDNETYPHKDPELFMYGAIIGCVDLVNIVRDHSSPFFTGPYGWILKNPRRIEPVQMRGMAGLFDAVLPAALPD